MYYTFKCIATLEFCLQRNTKGWFRTQAYLQETCHNERERSGIKKLIWECCILYTTLIGVVFGSHKTTGGQFPQVETDVDFVILGISSIFNDNS